MQLSAFRAFFARRQEDDDEEKRVSLFPSILNLHSTTWQGKEGEEERKGDPVFFSLFVSGK